MMADRDSLERTSLDTAGLAEGFGPANGNVLEAVNVLSRVQNSEPHVLNSGLNESSIAYESVLQSDVSRNLVTMEVWANLE